MNIREELFKMQDLEYRVFNSKLSPTLDIENIIGVRLPIIRNLAKALKNDPIKYDFLNDIPHKYLEENLLHVILLSDLKDFDEVIKYVDKFIPYIDNWAVCDTLRVKCYKKNRDKLLPFIDKWINNDYLYSKRYAIDTLMSDFLDEDFKEDYLYKVACVKSDEYYVNMMIAWYYATALAKQWNSTIKILENNVLDKWVHNKTIQKGVESFRITDEQKDYLRSLRRK